MAIDVRRVDASVTFPLRRRVLRPHDSVDDLAVPGADDPTSAHFAALDGGEVVGTGAVRHQAPPWNPEDVTAWRLRGMATTEERRGRGIGAAVLDAVVDHVARHGGGLLWCNARTPALSFYVRAGFEARGEAWVDPVIGPHIAMMRRVPATDPG